jgi:hypothetical protein
MSEPAGGQPPRLYVSLDKVDCAMMSLAAFARRAVLQSEGSLLISVMLKPFEPSQDTVPHKSVA